MDYIRLDNTFRKVGTGIGVIVTILAYLGFLILAVTSWFWWGWGGGLLMTVVFILLALFTLGVYVNYRAYEERNKKLDEDIANEKREASK